MEKVFWAKQKVINKLDKKAVELSAKLKTADDEEMDKILDKLDTIERLKETMNKPGVMKSKEFWVEVLKILGVVAALGAVIWYDSQDHVLPKSLEKWIPGPRL